MSATFTQEESFIDAVSLSKLQEGDLPTAGELTGIELRLSKVLIKDNKTPKIWPLPGLAQLYLLVVVVSDLDNPVQNIDLKGFHKVDDNEELPIDKTIFYWKEGDSPKNPAQINVFVSVIKSKEGLRDVGNVLRKVKDDQDYTDLVTNIRAMLTNATAFGQVTDSLFTLASIVGKYLGDVKDKPLMTWVQSFTDLNGDQDTLGKKVVAKENNDVAMAMTMIVRDKNREKEALKSQPQDVIDELNLPFNI